MSIGVPIKLLHEAEGHIVTIELKTGEVYRGQLIESEDNMNCQLGNITLTARDGRISNLEHAYVRGSKIRFLILPDMLKNAPMFKRVEASKSGGRGRGLGLGRGRGVRGRGRGGAARGGAVPTPGGAPNVFQNRK
uniref:Small nuclear ribonucleoprotein Sm D3 n=1 Tax=Physarum polycephalum TaxID=5791 RepID=F6KSS7_PHYPO|nr:Sm-D3-like protein [Physarum polycephalum]